MQAATIRAQIADEIKTIHAFDELESEHIRDALDWIERSVNIFRIEKPDKPPKHLVSYFVLVDPEHRSVLLGDHINAQLWLPSGGHVKFNEHPRQTVIRECREELRQEAIFLRGQRQPLFLTQTQTVGLTPGHTDVSLWYLLLGNVHDELLFDRSEFADMAWFTLDEILASQPSIFDPHMQRFAMKLNQYLDDHFDLNAHRR